MVLTTWSRMPPPFSPNHLCASRSVIFCVKLQEHMMTLSLPSTVRVTRWLQMTRGLFPHRTYNKGWDLDRECWKFQKIQKMISMADYIRADIYMPFILCTTYYCYRNLAVGLVGQLWVCLFNSGSIHLSSSFITVSKIRIAGVYFLNRKCSSNTITLLQRDFEANPSTSLKRSLWFWDKIENFNRQWNVVWFSTLVFWSCRLSYWCFFSRILRTTKPILK